MKKLSREEMKNVMGGDPVEQAVDTLDKLAGPRGCQGMTGLHGIIICQGGALYSVNQCADSSYVCSSHGFGAFQSCYCVP